MATASSVLGRGRCKLGRMLGRTPQPFPYWMCREWTESDLNTAWSDRSSNLRATGRSDAMSTAKSSERQM
ncbi:MAG: hypothetical protein HYX32_10415 [Actinobacteria bacterium]|nr:hypothetical protein [Actinomycetota bacterium]